MNTREIIADELRNQLQDEIPKGLNVQLWIGSPSPKIEIKALDKHGRASPDKSLNIELGPNSITLRRKLKNTPGHLTIYEYENPSTIEEIIQTVKTWHYIQIKLLPRAKQLQYLFLSDPKAYKEAIKTFK